MEWWVPDGEDVEIGGERGFDCLIAADVACRTGVFLALAVLLTEPDHFYGVFLLREAAFSRAVEVAGLFDEFATYF